MQQIKLKGLDEVIYYDKCDNGLEIYVWVNKKVNTFKGTITFKVGFDTLDFKIKNEHKSVPHGTAHYLEHILCKNENGDTVLGDFQKFGSYSNAGTYPDKTIYEFVGTNNLKDNLLLLLNCTQNKEFVSEYFESERGPILEEARMYLDHPERVLGVELNKSLYHLYPNKVPGTGTIEDIEKIKLSDLQDIYDYFYHPKNSFVTVTGNVNPQEVIQIIKDNQKEKEFKEYIKPTLPKLREPKKVVTPYKEVMVNIEVPRVYISAKIPLKSLSEWDIFTIVPTIQIVLSSNFGVTSILRDELMEKKLILNLSAYTYIERDYIIIQVVSKTKYPDEVVKILQDRLNNLEINKEDIERKRKAEIATLVLGFDEPESINDSLTYQLVKFGTFVTNEKEILEKLTYQKVNKIFSTISMKNQCVLVSLPKKEASK